MLVVSLFRLSHNYFVLLMHQFIVENVEIMLFGHIFRFIEFGNDGGPAAKTLKPKFNLFVKLVSKNTGLGVPHIDIKTVIAATMFLKGFGGLLFIVSSSFGAFLLHLDVKISCSMSSLTSKLFGNLNIIYVWHSGILGLLHYTLLLLVLGISRF
ncbi:HR-like lesion-inducing protein-related [Zea mays]|uniref:HR-like lesion-inducing protein-related n=1 Tax=Zea mays TaxID=4577 RepID=A0A1D6J436_MAIZE|nr:HR-like lesion-inducing protein-related [Zea mays]